ncbi:hypothetical protein EIP86_009113 [Pleurotus ostreatoroseus]|nr:hypothetical protein EIP86_009113 [Pleurotus ostreatoroseus]
MKYYEGIVKNTTDDLLTALRKREGESLDISAWMSFFGYDFMGHMCFSEDMGILNNGGDSKGLIRLIQIAFIEASWLSYIPWTVSFAKFLGGSKTLKRVQDLGEAAVEHRIAKGSENPDLFHYLLGEGEDEADRPSKITAMIDGQLATLAGSDTAAIALSHLWCFLLTHPKCYERLRQEIDETFPLKEDISSDLSLQSSMPYLNACMSVDPSPRFCICKPLICTAPSNESLRLYPPVITGLQREVRRGTGGRMLGPHFIPEGTQVSLWAYSMHRDPRYFAPLTNSFWPDRWLEQDKYTLISGVIVPKEQVVAEREVFMPFSHGPMVCAGKAVALAEMRAVVCAIVREFDLAVADQATVDNWEDSLREAFITLRGPLLVTLKCRE